MSSRRARARTLLTEPLAWLEALIGSMPGVLGRRIRAFWWCRRLGALGASSALEPGILMSGAADIVIGEGFSMMRGGCLFASEGGRIRIGDRVSCNVNVFLGATEGGSIDIGEGVLIGPNVVLRASNHSFVRTDIPIRDQGHTAGAIVIEEDVWLGGNATVLPDVRIGAHSVVGAGAVVTKDVAPWSVVGGVPAKLISKRNG